MSELDDLLADAREHARAPKDAPCVVVYQKDYTPTDDGDQVVYYEFTDVTVCHPFDEDETPVSLADEAMDKVGCFQPSAGPDFQPGIWYSNEPYPLYETGANQYREYSAHLHGFSEEQQREIWGRVTSA